MLHGMRWVVLGCCLLAALSGFGADNLGKVAYLNDGKVWVRELPDGTPQLVASRKGFALSFSSSGRWLLIRDDKMWESVLVYDLAHPRVAPHRLYGNNISWSPTADVLVYSQHYSGIYLTRPGSWRATTVLSGVQNHTTMQAVFPGSIEDLCWSPDGKRLAYIIMRKPLHKYINNNWDAYGEIHVINSDGSGEHKLFRDTPYGTNLLDLSWTPDMRYLLYFREEAQSASILAAGTPLYALPLAGGRPKLISKSTFSYVPAFTFSPDGKQLAVSEGVGRDDWNNRQLFLITLRTGVRKALTNPTNIAINPVWSPKGNKLAFVTAPSTPLVVMGAQSLTRLGPFLAARRIAILQLPQGSKLPHRNSAPHLEETDPHWSPDGAQLLYLRKLFNSQNKSLWVRNVKTGQSRQLVAKLAEICYWSSERLTTRP